MSSEETYHHVRFDEKNDTKVDSKEVAEIISDGSFNAVRVKTHVRFAEGMDWISPMPTLNSSYISTLPQDISVESGDKIGIHITHTLGLEDDELNISLRR